MSKLFKADKLNASAKTFEKLKTEKYPWWETLKKYNNEDKISIQIRKDNTIDVYCNGGGILTGLEYIEAKDKFIAKIHPKFIPLYNEEETETLTLSGSEVKFNNEIKIRDFSQLKEGLLDAVIKRIKVYNDSESEKGIQYNFIKKDPYIIDAEFQFDKLRIDLIRLDKDNKKIVFIELKTIGDSRLYYDNKDSKNKKGLSIYEQLKKYYNFLKDNNEELLKYYKEILKIKKELNLVKPILKNLSIDDWDVEPKPLLLFGDCTTRWIKKNAEDIDKKIKSVAYGAYYFGEPGLDLALIKKTNKNRHVY